MKKNFEGKSGTSIKIITDKIRTVLSSHSSSHNSKRKLKNSAKSGTIHLPDMRDLNVGLRIIERMIYEGFDLRKSQILLGSKDVSKTGKNIFNYRGVMENIISRLSDASITEQRTKERMDALSDYYRIAQASRDGIILKQETRTETVDGKEKEITYDTSMSPEEVISIFKDYERQSTRISYNKLDNYLGLGLGIIATLGAIAQSTKNSSTKIKQDKQNTSLIAIGTITASGLKLLQALRKTDDKDKLYQLHDEENRLSHEFIGNEQISARAEEIAMEGIKDIAGQEKKLEHKLDNRRFLYSTALNLITAIISGAYINRNVQIKGNGKIDGRSLAEAILSIQAAAGIGRGFVNASQGIIKSRKEEEDFQQLCQKVQCILDQMDEKVYPLEGAKHPFDSISIRNFKGQFYPKKDYETGETKYSLSLNIPEFSMKRGDVVLLSGESGTGKSTFLRFLKRGDINNRHAIELNNGEKVDNLGNEYISFRPSINLGNETNVLCQITGHRSISELKPAERTQLEKILRELKFDSPDLLEQLASKKFIEFSTGQQRRLALSKMFYRIDDGTSVIIVDEPVGNVENKLIREQLEMIKNYAKKRNVMLILTTHRLELAEDLATKRYNIDKDGNLVEVPVKSKEDSEISK